MFRFIRRSLLIILIVYLVVLGLNVSNQGVNQLTLEQRLPVLAVSLQSDRVILTWQGQEYVCFKDTIAQKYLDLLNIGRKMIEAQQ